MKWTTFFTNFFQKGKKQSSPISEAVSQGFLDVFREMGYRIQNKNEKPSQHNRSN
jgi:hypothetical protein